jgi:hypothetical protein
VRTGTREAGFSVRLERLVRRLRSLLGWTRVISPLAGSVDGRGQQGRRQWPSGGAALWDLLFVGQREAFPPAPVVGTLMKHREDLDLLSCLDEVDSEGEAFDERLEITSKTSSTSSRNSRPRPSYFSSYQSAAS